MSKRALFNFVTAGVAYEKGNVYSDEEVEHLDPSNFEDTDAVATPVEKTAEEIAAEKGAEITGDIDSTEGDDKKKADEGGAVGLDDNKGDLSAGPIIHEGVKIA